VLIAGFVRTLVDDLKAWAKFGIGHGLANTRASLESPVKIGIPF
jgi:hypothetical protein